MRGSIVARLLTLCGVLFGVFGGIAGHAGTAGAEVLNVEFKFTPFTGDPATADAVQTVAGQARVFLNGVPYADQEVSEGEVPVLFEAREIAPAVWLPAASCGPALRRGLNKIRIEFNPADMGAPYRAQLRWATVMSEATEQEGEGTYSATNQAGEGVEDKAAKGTVVFEREFQADFAEDLPWHHYPAVKALTDDDRKELTQLIARRLEAFRPDFSGVYALLEGQEGLDLAAIREARCIETAYEVGLRLVSAPAAEIEFIATGNPEVVLRAKSGTLFLPEDMSVFEKIEDEDMQMCAGIALSVAFPQRLVVVRSPAGAWEVVY